MRRWLFSHVSGLKRTARSRPDHHRARLRLDSMEDRVVPATAQVSNTSDLGAGSLRQALIDINGSADATNTITFLPGLFGTITLASDLPAIAKPVDIQGPGSTLITVNGGGKQLFVINDGTAASIPVSISGLKLTGGKNITTGGGAVYSKDEAVTLREVVVTLNTVGAGLEGGGIRADGGSFNLINSQVTVNTAPDGAGIRNAGATFVITGSQIEGNIATNANGTGGYYQSAGALQDMTNSSVGKNLGGVGGGLYITGGPATIVNSLIWNNNATNALGSQEGGGLAVAGGSVVLRNVTISGNKAADDGGGIRFTGGTLEIRNSTIAFNIADSDNLGGGTGGGLFATAGNKAKVFSTIIAKNSKRTDAGASQSDVSGELDATSSFNLVGVNVGLAGITDGTQGNLVGTIVTPRDPLFSPLAFNGGFTKTHAIATTSAAKDVGDATGLGLTTDGRGEPFARVVGAKADMGAFEIQAGPVTLVVTTAADENDPVYDAASLSLREALRLAGTDAATITFAPALNGQTITLTRGRLVIDRSVAVQGPGAKQLSVNGNGQFQIARIDDGDITTAQTVTISGLTLTNGKSDPATGGDGFGGALTSLENVTLDGMVISGNKATFFGGGVVSGFGTLTLKSSTVAGNTAATFGGGVNNAAGGTVSVISSTVSGNTGTLAGGGLANTGGGTLIVSNSTISGNQTKGDGGGIQQGFGGTLIVNNSTVAFNKADSDNLGGGKGGGVFVAGGTAKAFGTIVAKNEVGTTGANPDISGKLDAKFSLVFNTTGWDQTGSSNNKLNVDPGLVALADNGGPTQTHALPATGPATDPGFADADINPDGLTTDQRGTGFDRKIGASIDIGSFEFNPLPPATVSLSVTPASISEAAGVATVTATLSGATTKDVVINLTLGGTAAAGDFASSAAQITIPAGSLTGTITITAVEDATDEPDETVTVTLGTITNASAGTPNSITVTIQDNDGLPSGGQPAAVGGSLDGTARQLTASGGQYTLGSSLTFFSGSTANVRTATADVTGDGVPDFIGGTGPGVSNRVTIINGATNAVLVTFAVFEESFQGGLYVAAGDIDGDGKAEVVVTPDVSGGPVVALYRGSKLAAGVGGQDAQINRFFGIQGDPNFRGGCRPAMGDLNGDNVADLIIAAGVRGGPRIALFNGAGLATGGDAPPKIRGDFFAFEPSLRNGSFVASGDVTSDGKADIAFGGGPRGAPRVRVFDGAALLAAGSFNNVDEIPTAQRANFFAGDPALRGGVRLALRDVDANGSADLLAGSGEGEASRVRLYTSANLLANVTPSPNQEIDPFGGAVLANGVFVG